MTEPVAQGPTLRVAFWNAWLLSPRLWPSGPRVPFAGRVFAPDVERRATLVGDAVRDRFDVCALAEAFEQSEQAAIAAAAGSTLIAGPARAFPRMTGSGLATLVDERSARVVASRRLSYRSGGDLRDSDTFATKGALHVRVEVDPRLPHVDVVSTHLFAGGDLVAVPGANDAARHHRVRLAQLSELVDFVGDCHDPDAALVLAGDFNVAAHDPDQRLADPAERYREMVEALSPLGVVDVWAEHGVGLGHSCTFASPSDLTPDPSDPDRLTDIDDDAPLDPSHVAGERIDYLWFSPPRTGARVTLERPRRWAFQGRDAHGGPAGSLSDHLALSVTLRF